METVWRKCGSCKKDIGFNQIYQVCSVCKGKYAFCSVDCWDQHVPVMNHKSSWAEEKRSPTNNTSASNQSVRRIIASPSSSSSETDVLIVASKLKQYIKDKHDLSTSADVMEVLSHAVRRLSDQASAKAKAEGRKTLMSRDF